MISFDGKVRIKFLNQNPKTQKNIKSQAVTFNTDNVFLSTNSTDGDIELKTIEKSQRISLWQSNSDVSYGNQYNRVKFRIPSSEDFGRVIDTIANAIKNDSTEKLEIRTSDIVHFETKKEK